MGVDLFTPPDPDGAFFVERISIDGSAAKIAEWKSLLAEGWTLTVLMDYARSELVAFGHRPDDRSGITPDGYGPYEES